MTQDQYGQAPRDAGQVVRGDVVPDDETEVPQAEQSGPMTTRLKKVASALRGDGPDRTAPDQGAATGPDTEDPNGSWPTRPGEAHAVSTTTSADAVDDGEYADAARPDEVSAGPAGKHAADAADAGLRPGEATDRLGDFGDIAFGNLLPDAGRYTARWQQIQFRFVDDPQGSVTEAAEVISQVTAKLEAAIEERKRAIEERQRAIQERASALRGRWGEGSNADTETLRETLRMYRVFMDQLTGAGAS
jgi:hypothetical protein